MTTVRSFYPMITKYNHKVLDSTEELKTLFGNFKHEHSHVVTNYVPTQNLFSKWISEGTAHVYEFDPAIFVTNDKGFMIEAIFMTNDVSCISICSSIIRRLCEKPVVIERVIRENKDISVGHPSKILRRMSRSGSSDSFPAPSERVVKATSEDIPAIQNIFNVFFNQFTERIPDRDELQRLIENNGISLIFDKGTVAGMVVYEKTGINLHLRYWWVSPDHRNKGIGADLLRDYFENGRDCKRQFLWVFSDNTDAISKYRHYGFEFDGVADEIYIYK